MRAPLLLAVLLLPLGACTPDEVRAETLHLVATTGHLADATARILEGTDVHLTKLCGPGVDPHSYRATTADVAAMQQADAVLYNGLHLEAQLAEILHGSLADRAWAIGDAFPTERRLDWMEDGEIDPMAPFDPHVWNDLTGWAVGVEALIEHLANLYPQHSRRLRTNGAAYLAELRAAHAWALDELATIPQDRRLLVSTHDAFGYFARAYGLEVVAVLGIGNEEEASIAAMREVSEVIVQRRVPVIFAETVTSARVTEALQEACADKGWPVRISVRPLLSDDLGETPPKDTHLGALRSNVETIVAELRGSPSVTRPTEGGR